MTSTSSTLLPKLWLSAPRYQGSNGKPGGDSEECDCAGGGNNSPHDVTNIQTLMHEVAAKGIRDVRLSEDVFIDYIEDYIVALSATGAHIVVLDGQAGRLFTYLNVLSSMQSLKQILPWPSKVVEQIITLLLVEGILSSPQLQSPRIVEDNSTTLTAWLHLANGCNLSCKYCYLTFNGRQMDVGTAQQAINALYRSAVAHNYSRVKLKYAGGEPTLNFKALLAAQQQAEKLSQQTSIALDSVMLTNGVRLSNDQIDKLVSHNIHVMISLDGMDEFQNLQRPLVGQKKNSYQHVSQTLERLIERGISPHISVTITNKNVEGLPDFVDHLLNRGLRFSLNFYREPNDLPVYGELSFTSKQIISGFKSVFSVIESRMPVYSLLSALTDRADLRMPHSYTCGVGKNYMVINYDGHISKCQMEMSHSVTSIDVIDPLTLVQIDTNGIQNLSADEKELGNCVWRYRCTGGCSRLTFQRTGRYDAKSPMCEIYEAILPEVVRLEALRLIRYESSWDFEIH
jgi:uncharacterized protein